MTKQYNIIVNNYKTNDINNKHEHTISYKCLRSQMTLSHQNNLPNAGLICT